MNKKHTILFFLLGIISLQICSQIPPVIGENYLETFRGKCEKLEKSQIWDIVAGRDDYMFFASNDGLGVYDGVRWEVYDIPEGLVIRSLHYDPKTNILYSGSVNQFGKWEQAKNGKFYYTPLWVNQQKNVFVEFWRVKSPINSKYIYVQSHQLILKFNINSGTVEELKKSKNFSYMHIVAGDLWVQENGDLFRMNPDTSLKKIIDIEDRIIHISVRETDKRLIFFLEHKGAFILSPDFSKLTPLNDQSNAILGKAKIFAVNENRNGEYLIGTTKKGMYILDSEGLIKKNIGEFDGLPTSTVLSVSSDNYNNIWIGMDAGIAAFDTGADEQFFSPSPSIGNVRSIALLNNQIYIGTNQGLFKVAPDGGFSSIENTAGPTWSIQNIDGILYYNHDLGLFRLKDDKPVLIKQGGTTSLVRSITKPEYLVGGDYYGLSLYKTIDGRIEYIGKINDYAGASQYIRFDKHGYLWAMVPKEGFVRLKLSDDMLSVRSTKKYNMMPINSNKYLLMVVIDNNLIYYDGTTSYRYDEKSENLIPDENTKDIFDACGTKLLSINQFNNIFWYQKVDDIGYVVRNHNKLEKYSGIFSRIYNKRISPFIAHLNANKYMLGYQNGIAFTELNNRKNNHLKIRMAEGYGSGEPVLYGFDEEYFELPNNKRLLNIYPININPDKLIEYRILEIDSTWVKEKIESALSLTHLEWGTYTIQLRNAEDTKHAPAQMLVKIAPPWYVSTPMILVYIAVCLLIILIVYLYLNRRMKKDKIRMERKKQALIDKLEKDNLIQSQQILELEKDKLEIELKDKDKRLAFITMNGVKRNNLMNELKKEIKETEKYEQNRDTRQIIKKVIKKIDEELAKTNDWDIFEKYFNVVFDGLLEQLAAKYPQLTQGDLKMLAYLKVNLSNKEIADLLNISHRSVEMSKYRLRKKLNLDNNDNFGSILNQEIIN